MNDKEKEAIEYLKKEIEEFQQAQKSADEEIDDRNWFKKLWCEWQNDIDMRTTVLNLIEKQQAELEKKDKIINASINEIEMLKQDFSEDLQVEFIRILEILKDKKVIDW